MSISWRIILLTLIVIGAITTAFYVEYRHLVAVLDRSEMHQRAIERAGSLASLVRVLQSERGLTGGFLIGGDKRKYALLQRQRQNTDRVIASFTPDDPAIQQVDHLASMRAGVDRGGLAWPRMKNFYSSWVQQLMNVKLEVSGAETIGDMTLSLVALRELGSARENLALIRAALYRIYLRGTLSRADQHDVIAHYALFHEQLNHYLRFATTPQRLVFAPYLDHRDYRQVISLVEAIKEDGAVQTQVSPELWWTMATAVIDRLGLAEQEIFQQLQRAIGVMVEDSRTRLRVYAIAAGSLGVFAVLMTILTLNRILTALSELTRTLDNVMQSGSFKSRIKDLKHDELGHVGERVNELLQFTERVIKDKDFLASHDELTAVYTRRRFQELAQRELIRDDRYGSGVVLIYCDIDYFKSINDRFGHVVGDAVLRRFASNLVQHCRGNDLVARWGGEEFVILTPESDLDRGVGLAQKLRRETAALQYEKVGHLTASFGVAARRPGESFGLLCARADLALYRAKAGGRDQVCVHD